MSGSMEKKKSAFQTIYDALGYSPGGVSYAGVLYIRREWMPDCIKEVRIVDDETYNLAAKKSAWHFDQHHNRIPNPYDDGEAP